MHLKHQYCKIKLMKSHLTVNKEIILDTKHVQVNLKCKPWEKSNALNIVTCECVRIINILAHYFQYYPKSDLKHLKICRLGRI